MRIAVVLGLMSAVLLCGCNKPAQSRPGSPEVYQRIAGLSDCRLLQGEFDTASANHGRSGASLAQMEAASGYMAAADERMRAVGCYKQ